MTEVTAVPAAGARDWYVLSPRYVRMFLFFLFYLTLLTFIYMSMEDKDVNSWSSRSTSSRGSTRLEPQISWDMYVSFLFYFTLLTNIYLQCRQDDLDDDQHIHTYMPRHQPGPTTTTTCTTSDIYEPSFFFSIYFISYYANPFTGNLYVTTTKKQPNEGRLGQQGLETVEPLRNVYMYLTTERGWQHRARDVSSPGQEISGLHRDSTKEKKK